MRLLVIAQGYPSKTDIYVSGFIHTRHLYYLEQSTKIDLVSFTCKQSYNFEGITVYPSSSFKQLIQNNPYDAIICHAPNLRNHLRLILPFINKLPKIFFVFHGHEILHKSRYYPQPYDFQKGKLYFLCRFLVNTYDNIKCRILKLIIQKYGGKKIFLIFVSQYLQKLFEDNIKIPYSEFKEFSKVIHNSLHPIFIKSKYDLKSKKKYDFITLRPFDKSVYALDLILKIAQQNPNKSFHIYGEGEFFNHNTFPSNISVIKGFIKPQDIPTLLNQYKSALMPSYHDSQGVMACEMAVFGIPLIVSNIPAAREMLTSTKNVWFINNDDTYFDLDSLMKNTKPKGKADLRERFSAKNTAFQELRFYNKYALSRTRFKK